LLQKPKAMKKLLLSIPCFLIVAQVLAQDCSQYLYLQKNKTIEMTAFNKKGDVVDKTVSKVSNVSTSKGVTTANVVTEIFDKNGKSMGMTSADYTCNGNGITMQMHMDGQQSKQPATMDIKVNTTSGDPEFPADMKVGDHLKDYTSQVQMISGMVSTVNITDRMVLAKEDLTTPAGTFNCFKISYKSSNSTAFTKSNSDTVNKVTSMFGKLGIKMPTRTSETTVWYAPGFAVVKIETKNSTIEITGIK
jgi:hypothetical protein